MGNRSLRTQLQALEEKHNALASLVMRAMRPVTNVSLSSPYSLQGKVVGGAIELCISHGGPATSKDILTFLEHEKGIDLGRRKRALLAAILGQEVKKKSARLQRVARGMYNIR